MSEEGSFIVLEGIDKCGKSTVQSRMRDNVSSQEFVFTQEPSSRDYGEIMRRFISRYDNNPSVADFFLFMADRYDHTENFIKPWMNMGYNVVCDRYHLSTLAYQSPILDEQLGLIEPMNYIDNVTGYFVKIPDLTIYIDIPIETALDRVSEEDRPDRYEYEDTLTEAKRIYDYYEEQKDHIVRVDGTQPEEEVYQDVMDLVWAWTD